MDWWLVLAVIAVYFLPTLMATGKRGGGGVFILNLFLGWTFLFWVIALSWAVYLPKLAPVRRDE